MADRTWPQRADIQLAAQRKARETGPRRGYPYRIAHVEGDITNHRTFGAARAHCKFGSVLYMWHNRRWAIWTSAGLL